MEELLIYIYFYISRGTRYYEKVCRSQNFAIGNFSMNSAEAALHQFETNTINTAK